MRFCLLTVLFAFATVPFANLATHLASRWDNMRVKHTWHVAPANWETLGHPPPDTTIDLHIALKPHRETAMTDALYEVSDPGHPKEQVAELVEPHPDTLGLVTSWLEDSGVSVSSPVSMTHGGGWLTVTGVPVSQANDLLGASYQLYRYTSTNTTLLRTVGYSLPTALHDHVQTVVPTTYFSAPRTLQQSPRKRSMEEEKAKATSGGLVAAFSSRDDNEPEVVPAVLRRLYNTEAYVPISMDQNVLAVAGYLDDLPSLTDLDTFMQKYRTDVVATTFPVPIIPVNDGAYNFPSNPSTEANMNVQYVEGMAYPTPIVYYSIGGESDWEQPSNLPSSKDADLVWLNYVLKLQKTPQTISISYGNTEPGFPPEYTKAICDLFEKLALRGSSVLLATGDFGVGPEPEDCKNDAGKVQFVPIFPASCPFVTSVGGTTGLEPEVGAKHSGGGFSFHFPRPPYQKDVVPNFLQQLGSEYSGMFNPNGRGMPDISAQIYDFQIILSGNVIPQHGTSCSAPTVAGVISLLSDYQISRGEPALGFLNPWLYGSGLSGLNDITSGSNPGCGTKGFSAKVGWDPVTGLGTPDFLRLQQNLPQTPRASGVQKPTF